MINDKYIELMPWQQRLNNEELRLCLTFLHWLEDDERDKRQKIMRRETMRDQFWGFYDEGKDAARRRKYYFLVIHRQLTKQPKKVIHPRYWENNE